MILFLHPDYPLLFHFSIIAYPFVPFSVYIKKKCTPVKYIPDVGTSTKIRVDVLPRARDSGGGRGEKDECDSTTFQNINSFDVKTVWGG